MQFRRSITRVVGAGAMLIATGALHAQGPVKLGLIAPFSGPFAQYGQQMNRRQ